MTVSILYARRDSIYKNMPDCDVWDASRDARLYDGNNPVVAHPPCRAWAGLRGLARPIDGEKELAIHAVGVVRRCGGGLEHPVKSVLWDAAGMSKTLDTDEFGGWTFVAQQYWFGHRAEKLTRFYVVGILPRDLPSFPLVLGRAPCVISSSSPRKSGVRPGREWAGYRPEVTKSEREHTPAELAAWLVGVAGMCGGRS